MTPNLFNSYRYASGGGFGFASDFGNNSDGWTLGSAFTLDTTNARVNFSALTSSGGVLSYDNFDTGSSSWILDVTQDLTFTDSNSRWGFGVKDGSIAANARGTFWSETNSAWNEWQIHVCGCAVCNSGAYGSITPSGTWYVRQKHNAVDSETTMIWYPSASDRTNDTNGTGLTSPNSAETGGCNDMNFFAVTSSDNNPAGAGASGWVKDISLYEWTP